MAAVSSASASQVNGFALPQGDKYRGAVVEVRRSSMSNRGWTLDSLSQDLQLPPAFALPSDEAISRAIESAYERDFSYIPYVHSSAQANLKKALN